MILARWARRLLTTNGLEIFKNVGDAILNIGPLILGIRLGWKMVYTGIEISSLNEKKI
jgi:hypothetical protein